MSRNYEVTAAKFHLVANCTTGEYTQKLMTELYNYLFILLASFTIQTEAFEGKVIKLTITNMAMARNSAAINLT